MRPEILLFYESLTIKENIGRFYGGIYGAHGPADYKEKGNELITKLGLEKEATKWWANCPWDGNRSWPFR